MSTPPLKILAVDNEQLLLFALERAFKGRSFDINTATSIEQALVEIGHGHFDLFLVDFDLLDQSSLELLKTIDELCPYVPIIVMAASAMNSSELNDVIRTIRTHGIWHLLEKPFSLDKMLNLVTAMFQDREYDIFGLKSLTHNYGKENRDRFRRPYIQPVHFSYKAIAAGASTRVSAKGILTDISARGSGILAHKQMQPAQVISFEEEFLKKVGIVAWSVMIESNTCRFGVQFC